VIAGSETKLDRRRDKAQSAKAAADTARQRVSALDDRLAATGAQSKEHEAALRRARDEMSRRKKALKASAKKRDQLRTSRKKAGKAAAKARRRARGAEQRYDQVVLAEMVRREKERDRAAAAAHARPSDDGAATGQKTGHKSGRKAGERTGGGSGGSVPTLEAGPERAAIGVTTATRTAARKTADRAAG
jgi:chromosome segregation ATPase